VASPMHKLARSQDLSTRNLFNLQLDFHLSPFLLYRVSE
jgi:hypothetical protein